jgi:hypothetical protein
VAAPPTLERDLQMLDAELRKLEAEYNMFFAGQLPKPPWETRSRVEALIKRYDRGHIESYVDRFRFNTLQARYATFADLWDRGLRAREEGRPGPFSRRNQTAAAASESADRILHVTTLADPAREQEKVHELYERIVEARKGVGQESVPFHKFVHLLRDQVTHLRKSGSPEVAFRVAIRAGKVSLTARALKGVGPDATEDRG